jgi:hypothetical protein
MAVSLSQLGPGATLGDLPAQSAQFDENALGSRVAAAFQHHPDLPGAIVHRTNLQPAVVSRQNFRQELGKRKRDITDK